MAMTVVQGLLLLLFSCLLNTVALTIGTAVLASN